MPVAYDVINAAVEKLSTFADRQLIPDPLEYFSANGGANSTNDLFWKDPDTVLDYLKDWDFVGSLITLIGAPIKEVISGSPITISLKGEGNSKYEDFLNKQLDDTGLRKILVTDIEKTIYRGSVFYYISTNKRDRTIKFHSVKHSHKFKVVYGSKNRLGYLLRNKFVSLDQGVAYTYRETTVKDIPISILSKELKERFRKQNPSIPEDMESKVVAYSHSKPRSMFSGVANKLFQIYLNELIMDFLALKDSIRQELITVTLTANPKNVFSGSSVAQRIEETMNMSSNMLMNQDPQATTSQVIFQLFNAVRVLPQTDGYSQINKIDLNSFVEKREQLSSETQKLKEEVLASLRIPLELYTGSGNRWEIASRSDSYLTALNDISESYTAFIKLTVQSIMASFGRYIRLEDITFNYMNNTPLQSQMARNKVAMFNENLKVSLESIQAVKALVGTGFYDPEKLVEIVKGDFSKWGLQFEGALNETSVILRSMGNEVNEFPGGV